MSMEKYVVSLELAKKLKGLRVPQESEFVWNEEITYRRQGQKDGSVPYILHSTHVELFPSSGEDITLGNDDYRGDYRTDRSIISAYLSDELLEWLPEDLLFNALVIGYNSNLGKYFINNPYEDAEVFDGNTLPNALAKMMIYLIEEGIVKVEDLK